MLTIQDMKRLIADAEQHAGLTDASEIRIITRTPCNDVSLMDAAHATILPASTRTPPTDRRYGDGVLLLAQESIMRPAPDHVLNKLDWK